MSDAALQLATPPTGLPSRDGEGADPSGLCAPRADARLRANGKPDYSHEFIECLYHDIERIRARRHHVLRTVNDPPIADNVAEIWRRLQCYEEFSNRDYLIDVARYALWEWIDAEDKA